MISATDGPVTNNFGRILASFIGAAGFLLLLVGFGIRSGLTQVASLLIMINAARIFFQERNFLTGWAGHAATLMVLIAATMIALI